LDDADELTATRRRRYFTPGMAAPETIAYCFAGTGAAAAGTIVALLIESSFGKYFSRYARPRLPTSD
jgi:hypothetical protein